VLSMRDRYSTPSRSRFSSRGHGPNAVSSVFLLFSVAPAIPTSLAPSPWMFVSVPPAYHRGTLSLQEIPSGIRMDIFEYRTLGFSLKHFRPFQILAVVVETSTTISLHLNRLACQPYSNNSFFSSSLPSLLLSPVVELSGGISGEIFLFHRYRIWS
jgi:hypothetical protein